MCRFINYSECGTLRLYSKRKAGVWDPMLELIITYKVSFTTRLQREEVRWLSVNNRNIDRKRESMYEEGGGKG
jgi:hypothetical protein